jgi:hypothetical protein
MHLQWGKKKEKGPPMQGWTLLLLAADSDLEFKASLFVASSLTSGAIHPPAPPATRSQGGVPTTPPPSNFTGTSPT